MTKIQGWEYGLKTFVDLDSESGSRIQGQEKEENKRKNVLS
jgi:hypothetical protein